jgi:MFS family permease
LAAAGLGLLMYGISEGPFDGWGSALSVNTITFGALLLGALIWVELRRAHPLIDFRLFSDRLFRSTNAVLALGAAAFIGTLFLVALFFQDGLGLSALQSGLNTFPEAIGVMVGSQVITRWLYPNFGPRRVMVGGTVVLSAALAALSLVGFHTNLWWVRADMFIVGYGMSHVIVSAQAAGFATISPANMGRASTLFNALRQVGAAIGVALLSTVIATVGPVRIVDGHVSPYLTAYHVAFLVAAGVALLSGVCALTVSDADAAGTIVRRTRSSRRADTMPSEAPEPVPAGG